MKNYLPEKRIYPNQPLYEIIRGEHKGEIGNLMGALCEIPNHTFLGIAFVSDKILFKTTVEKSKTDFKLI